MLKAKSDKVATRIEREYTFLLIIVTTGGKICEFHLRCCAWILSILLPGKKMLVSSPTRKSSIVNIIKITATYLLKPFDFKVFIDFWPRFC